MQSSLLLSLVRRLKKNKMKEIKITKENINDLVCGDIIKYHNGYEWRERIVDDFILERHFFPTGIGNETCDLLYPLFGNYTYKIKKD